MVGLVGTGTGAGPVAMGTGVVLVGMSTGIVLVGMSTGVVLVGAGIAERDSGIELEGMNVRAELAEPVL